MIVSARLNPEDSDIEFDLNNEHRYRKQAKNGVNPEASAEDAESTSSQVSKQRRPQLSSVQPTVCYTQSSLINGRH